MGVVERKNITLQEMAHVMFKAKIVLLKFWAEALNIACYTQNRVYLRQGNTMTPYEIWRGKKPNLKLSHEFGSTCFVLNDGEHMSKFDAKNDESMFLEYPLNRAYRIFNRRTKTTTKLVNMVVDDHETTLLEIRKDNVEAEVPYSSKTIQNDSIVANDASLNNSTNPASKGVSSSSESSQRHGNPETKTSTYVFNRESSRQVQEDHSTTYIIRELEAGIRTRGKPKVN